MKHNKLAVALVLAFFTINAPGGELVAQTQEDNFQSMLTEINELDLDELVMWKCYHQFPKDQAAQKACEPGTMDATRALIADLPDYADDLLAPAFSTIRIDKASLGGSHFGGRPDAPKGFIWPVSKTFLVKDAQKFHQLKSQEPMRESASPLPMTFIAQISLADLGGIEPDWPETGRLLIFMDYAVWFAGESGVREPGVRIIWDQTPVDDLARAETPGILVTLDEQAHTQHAVFEKEMAAMLSNNGSKSLLSRLWPFGKEAENDLDEVEVEPFHSEFLPPFTPVRIERQWTRLNHHVIELRNSKYSKRVSDTNAVDIASELESIWPGEAADDAPPFHQLLGKPFPEQDDPRYDVVFQKLLGREYETSKDRQIMHKKTGLTGDAFEAYLAKEALNYVMLLQLDAASFLDINTEGTFYFFLHREDLKTRQFDEIFVIYQQT